MTTPHQHIRVVVITACITIFACLSQTGCSKNSYPIAPVTGKITLNGQPMPSVNVNFIPLRQKNSIESGPGSAAVTDENGVFVMKTSRFGPGASVGENRVELGYFDLEDLILDFETVKAEVASEPSDEAQAEFEALQAKLKKRLKGKKSIPSTWARDSANTFVVPASGTDSANFELSETSNTTE